MRQSENTATAEKIGGSKLRNDIIFITVILLLTAALGLCYLLLGGEGDTVAVIVDGETFATYSLSENREVEIVTEHGRNLLVIEDGRAYVSEASCPDGICSSHRPISRQRETVTCLPNKLVVKIIASEQSAPDVSI